MPTFFRSVTGLLQWLSIFLVSTAMSVWLGSFVILFAFIPALVLATASLRNLSADRDRNVLRRLRIDFGLVALFVVLVLIVSASLLFGSAGYDKNNPPAANFLGILLWTAAWAVGQVVALCGISAGFELLLRLVDRRVTTRPMD